MKVKAAVLRAGDAPFAVEELTLEAPRDDEVLVRIVAAGLCHTDLLARELPPEFFPGPCVYGHEGAGIVEAVGSTVTHVAPGDHVVLSFRNCGTCVACANNRPAYCPRLTELNLFGCRPDGTTALTDRDGSRVGSHFFGQSSFSSYSVVARECVVKMDPAYDLATLAPLGCGIQTGAGAVLNCFNLQEGQSIVVAGAGAVGLAAVMAAKIAGAGTIIALDRHPNRLALARKYGATETLSVDPDELANVIRDVTGDGADYAFDTTGNAHIVRAAFDGLNYLGTLGLCGVGFGEVAFDFGTLLSGRRIMTVLEGDSRPTEFIPHLAEMNAEGRFRYDELIGTFTLEEINDAEAASASGAVVKPVLIPS